MPRQKIATTKKAQLNEETNLQMQSRGKLRAPPIRWSDAEIRTIVLWFCHRDQHSVPTNYDAYSNENQQATGERMLKDTGLDTKHGVNKQKAADKINDMIKTYKEWQVKAEGSGWGTGQDEHEGYFLSDGPHDNVKVLLLSKCFWYYDFESVFHRHPTINPPLIIETGELPRRNGKAVHDDRDLAGMIDENEIGDLESNKGENGESTYSNHDEFKKN